MGADEDVQSHGLRGGVDASGRPGNSVGPVSLRRLSLDDPLDAFGTVGRELGIIG